MKKESKIPRKLTLNRETLRQLEDRQLREAAGGGTIANSASDSCFTCLTDIRC